MQPEVAGYSVWPHGAGGVEGPPDWRQLQALQLVGAATCRRRQPALCPESSVQQLLLASSLGLRRPKSLARRKGRRAKQSAPNRDVPHCCGCCCWHCCRCRAWDICGQHQVAVQQCVLKKHTGYDNLKDELVPQAMEKAAGIMAQLAQQATKA